MIVCGLWRLNLLGKQKRNKKEKETKTHPNTKLLHIFRMVGTKKIDNNFLLLTDLVLIIIHLMSSKINFSPFNFALRRCKFRTKFCIIK